MALIQFSRVPPKTLWRVTPEGRPLPPAADDGDSPARRGRRGPAGGRTRLGGIARASSGLTLIELLIAATMMSILFLGLATHLRGGITVWQRVTETGEALQRQRVGLDWLERDLANIFEYKDARDTVPLPAPEFTHDRLAFITLQSTGYQQPARVRYVTYECAEHDGVKGLWRTNQTIGEARAKHEVVPTLTLPDCDTWSLRYAYLAPNTPPTSEPKPLDWQDEWKLGPKFFPRLIQISLKLSGQTILRIFAIPAGALELYPI